MKKLLVFSMVLVSFVSYGQDRVDLSTPSWSGEYQSITKSIGWKYNSDIGKWVSNENTIYPKKLDYIFYGAINFTKIQIKELNFESKKYYVLLIDELDNYYKYPAIRQDPVEFKKITGYVIDEVDFNKLKNIDDEVTIRTIRAESITNINEPNEQNVDRGFRVRLGGVLNKKSSKFSYVFKVKKTMSEGKIVYRFLLPITLYDGKDFDTKKVYETRNINDEYFEVSDFSVLTKN